MFARWQEVVTYTQVLVEHFPEARLLKLLDGLQTALTKTRPDYVELSHAAQWLADLADTLNPQGKPTRTGEQVRNDWLACLTRIETQGQNSPRLQHFSAKICKVSKSYAQAYSIPETIAAISHVQHDQFLQERQRVQLHRAPFRLHTRSARQSEKQLQKLVRRWKMLPASHDP